MKAEIFAALAWIVGTLDNNNIPYVIGGGLAVSIYGGGRAVNDIDISVSGKYFQKLIPLVQNYIATDVTHYRNEKWDCHTLSLSYNGQDIDLTDVDTLKMSNLAKTKWLKNKEIYRKYPNIATTVNDLEVIIMHPKVLLEYKSELDGEHQRLDVEFLKNYIENNY